MCLLGMCMCVSLRMYVWMYGWVDGWMDVACRVMLTVALTMESDQLNIRVCRFVSVHISKLISDETMQYICKFNTN